MNTSKPLQDDFDNTWKDALDLYLQQFMLLFFPDVHDEIDWSKGYESLDKELRSIVYNAETGKRFVDQLVKVFCKNSLEAWVYIHLEVQSQQDHTLPERVYVYNSSHFLRYKRPIMSLVVLGDSNPNWKPETFEFGLWGSQVHFRFQTVKLLDYRDKIEELKQSGNPFAFFVIAHLKTLETKGKPQQRLSMKELLSKELLLQGWSGQDVYYFFKFIDGMMTLPEDLEQEFLDNIHTFQEEKKMPVLAPFEQIAMDKGRLEGKLEGNLEEAQFTLLDALQEKFGAIPPEIVDAIQTLNDVVLVRRLRKQARNVDSLSDWIPFIREAGK